MVVHSASRFMQRIGKKRTLLQFQHPNYVCFDAYKAKYVHTAIHDLKFGSGGHIEIACFPYGQLPSINVDKHHDWSPSKD